MGAGEGVRVVARQAAVAWHRRALDRALVRGRAAARLAARRASARALRGAGGAPRRAHQAQEVSATNPPLTELAPHAPDATTSLYAGATIAAYGEYSC